MENISIKNKAKKNITLSFKNKTFTLKRQGVKNDDVLNFYWFEKDELKKELSKCGLDNKELKKIKNIIDNMNNEKIFTSFNDFAKNINESDDFYEGPQPGDAEYHYSEPTPSVGIGRFNFIDWQMLHETLLNNMQKDSVKYYKSDLTDSEEGLLNNDEYNLLENKDIIETDNGIPVLTDEYLDYNTFYNACQLAWDSVIKENVEQLINSDNTCTCTFCDGTGEAMVSCCTGESVDTDIAMCPICKEHLGLETCPTCYGSGLMNKVSEGHIPNMPSSVILTKNIVDNNNLSIPMDTVLEITYDDNIKVVFDNKYVISKKDFEWYLENGKIEVDGYANDSAVSFQNKYTQDNFISELTSFLNQYKSFSTPIVSNLNIYDDKIDFDLKLHISPSSTDMPSQLQISNVMSIMFEPRTKIIVKNTGTDTYNVKIGNYINESYKDNYVIIRTDNGKYFSKNGENINWTDNLELAYSYPEEEIKDVAEIAAKNNNVEVEYKTVGSLMTTENTSTGELCVLINKDGKYFDNYGNITTDINNAKMFDNQIDGEYKNNEWMYKSVLDLSKETNTIINTDEFNAGNKAYQDKQAKINAYKEIEKKRFDDILKNKTLSELEKEKNELEIVLKQLKNNYPGHVFYYDAHEENINRIQDKLNYTNKLINAKNTENVTENISNALLTNFDLNDLDQFEQFVYADFIKHMSKEEALQIIINNVEGDYSQLSTKLAEVAEQLQPANENTDNNDIIKPGDIVYVTTPHGRYDNEKCEVVDYAKDFNGFKVKSLVDDSVFYVFKGVDEIIKDSSTPKALRSVTVEFEDGDVINTNMAAHLTDADILDYYKVGKTFNLGNGDKDKMVAVKNVIINENITDDDIELRSNINNIIYKRTSYIKNEFGGNERVIKELDAIKLIDDIFYILKNINKK